MDDTTTTPAPITPDVTTSAPATTAITDTTRRQWSIVHPAHALLTELENFMRDVGFDAHEMIEKIRETL